MRVALLALHFSEYSVSLARALAKDNQVLLLISDKNFIAEVGDYDILNNIPNLEYVVVPHKKSIVTIMRNVFLIINSIKAFSPDVIHCQEQIKDYLMLSLPFIRRYPFVLTIHDPVLHSGVDTKRAKYSRLALYYKIIRNYPDAIIVHGDEMRRLSEQLFSKPVFSAHHGPLGEIFDYSSEEPYQQGVCLFFGRIEEYKGIRYFIDAVKKANRVNPAVRGLIAGRGNDLEPYRQDIANSSTFILQEKYLSPTEVLAVFARANVVVMPYVDASQSGVGAYALGLGKPLIVSRVGSLTDLVEEGHNGYSVAPRDSDDLAEKILALCANEEIYQHCSAGSTGLAKGKLSWAKAAASTIQAYEYVLNGRV